jgi:histone H3/H4
MQRPESISNPLNMSTGAGPAEEGHEPTPRRTWTWSGILPTRDGPMTQHNSIPSVRHCPGIRNHPLLCFPLGEQSKAELVSTVATNMSLGERGICCCDKKIPKSSSDTLASLPPSKSPPSSVAPCRPWQGWREAPPEGPPRQHQGITKPPIRRLARRGGVKCISGLIYVETRGVLKILLENVIRDVVTYTEHARSKTVTAMDVVEKT